MHANEMPAGRPDQRRDRWWALGPEPGRAGALRCHPGAFGGHRLRRQPGVPGRPAQPGHRPSHRLPAVHACWAGPSATSRSATLPTASTCFRPWLAQPQSACCSWSHAAGQQPAGRRHSQRRLRAQHDLVVAGHHRRGLHPARPGRGADSLSDPARTRGRATPSLALVFGLALAHHRTTLLLAPGVPVYLLWSDPGVLRRPRDLAMLALALPAAAAALPLSAPARPERSPRWTAPWSTPGRALASRVGQRLRLLLQRQPAGRRAAGQLPAAPAGQPDGPGRAGAGPAGLAALAPAAAGRGRCWPWSSPST